MMFKTTWLSFRTNFRSPVILVTILMSLVRGEGAVSHVSFSKGGGSQFSYEILHDHPGGGHRGSSQPFGFGGFGHEIRTFPIKTKSSILSPIHDIGLSRYFNGGGRGDHLAAAGPIPASLKSYFRSSKPSHYGNDIVKTPAPHFRTVNKHFHRYVAPLSKIPTRPKQAVYLSDFPPATPAKSKFIPRKPSTLQLPAFIDPIHGTGLKFGLWSPALGPPIRNPKGYHYSKGFRPGKLVGGFRPSYGPPGFKKPSYLDFAFYPSPSYYKLFDNYEENFVPYEDIAGSFTSLRANNAQPSPAHHDNIPAALPTSFIRQKNLGFPVILNDEGTPSLLNGANPPQEVTYHGFTGDDYKRLVKLPKVTPTTTSRLRTLIPPDVDASPSEMSVEANVKPSLQSLLVETSSTPKQHTQR